MQTMYRVRDRWGSFEFVKVEVDKVTDSTVTIKGQRAFKCSDGTRYFESFDEAQQYAMECIKREYDRANKTMRTAESRLIDVKSLTEHSIAVSHSRW